MFGVSKDIQLSEVLKKFQMIASTIVNVVIICIMLFYIKVTRSRLRSQIIFVLKLWPFP